MNCSGTMVDDGEFRALIVRYRLLEHLPMIKDGSAYRYTGHTTDVVIADETSIKQYLFEPAVNKAPQLYRGAFGRNPAFALD